MVSSYVVLLRLCFRALFVCVLVACVRSCCLCCEDSTRTQQATPPPTTTHNPSSVAICYEGTEKVVEVVDCI